MERIASFCVDHTKLERGMYLSRQDGDVLTWDIRMKKPNQGDYLTTGAAHTLEHLFATYARNSAYQHGVIYVGPMGCRTGFYLLTRGLTPAEALALTVDSFRFMAAFEGDIPGASEVECGNYRDMDLPAAKAEAAAMLPVLEALTAEDLQEVITRFKAIYNTNRTCNGFCRCVFSTLSVTAARCQLSRKESFLCMVRKSKNLSISGEVHPAKQRNRVPFKSGPVPGTLWRCRPRTPMEQCGRRAFSGSRSRSPCRH